MWNKFSVFVCLTTSLNLALAAEGGASKADAEAMVKKGVAAIKSEGKDKVYNDISSRHSKYVFHDLYLVVYSLNGVVLAHGANPKMIGKDLLELRDVDGKAFVKERVELAKSQNSFWQRYKFPNPETKQIEPKLMYCEKLQETVVCGGVYE